MFYLLVVSWQSYVDTNLVGTRKIVKAAIYGHDKSLWATSPGFNVTFFIYLKVSAVEIDTLLKAFKDPSGIRASGLRASGIKYFALKTDERSIYGKQVIVYFIGGS